MLFLQMAAGPSKKPILISLGILAFINFDGLYAHIWTPWTLKYLPYHEGSCASKLNHPTYTYSFPRKVYKKKYPFAL